MRSELKALAEDSALYELEDLLFGFNLFEGILRNPRRETQHSDVLAFLLSPTANHGLGDAFLRSLISRAVPAIGRREPGALSNARVRREDEFADIIITDKVSRVMVLIENKVDSGEGDGQLLRYHARFEKRFQRFTRYYVFLTPEGAEPSAAQYSALSYRDVCDALHECSSVMSEGPTRQFLTDYARFLRRYIVDDEEAVRLAQELGRKHRVALDFIRRHSTSDQADTETLLLQTIARFPELMSDRHQKGIVRFVPRAWEDIPPLTSGERAAPQRVGWTGTGRVLLFELKYDVRSVRPCLYIGPNHSGAGAAILEATRLATPPFDPPESLSAGWTRVWTGDPLRSDSPAGLSPDETRAHVEAVLEDLVTQQLPKMTAVLSTLRTR